MELLQREAKKYTGNFIKEKRALGELDHPDSSVVNLNNVSHNVLEMHWDGNDLLGTIEVLTTPKHFKRVIQKWYQTWYLFTWYGFC